MNGRYTLEGVYCAVLLAMCFVTHGLQAQSPFEECEKREVELCVLEYAVNRENFKDVFCCGYVDYESIPFSPKLSDSQSMSKFFFVENLKHKTVRRDWKTIDLKADDQAFDEWQSVIVRPAGLQRFHGRVEFIPKEEVGQTSKKSGEIQEGVLVPSDIWSLAFTDATSVGLGRATASRWMEVFDMKKLLFAEESSEIVRGEWSFGPTARMQVYFSKKFDRMPIYCRFYLPEDPKTYFGTKYKKAANEIETQWIKRKEGWAPSQIRNYKEQKTSDGKLQVGRSTRYQFFWDSSIKFDGKLLEFGEISSEEIFDSFTEAR